MGKRENFLYTKTGKSETKGKRVAAQKASQSGEGAQHYGGKKRGSLQSIFRA